MEHFGKKGKLLDQIDDARSAPSTSRSKVKSPHKERENFRSTLVNVIMWVLQANQHVSPVSPWPVTTEDIITLYISRGCLQDAAVKLV